MEIRTVELELLRAGPPHNQLLSPLTQYLGVCGESGAGVVRLPWEQYKFDRRLEQLRYEGGTEEDVAWRLELLRDTGLEIGRLLGAVPGLAGLLEPGCSERTQTLSHLRVVLSASELALLPWEMARVPEGAQIPDSWLLLQRYAPLCLTRHIRSVPTASVRWPASPRLLFVTGDPDELPIDEHRQALHKAIGPWRKAASGASQDDSWPDWVSYLENASVEAIERACGAAQDKGRPFTHIHVLAHGADDENSEGTSFGLLLADTAGDPDVVSGERFASAITGSGSCPAVVTLATCDSGNTGDIKTPGASFAHSLHQEAGVPLVVASQFPLSMDGSKVVVERLYSGLLWGEHPLQLLYRIRTELHSRYTNQSHDWASLVVYESLPPDLTEQLRECAYQQSKKALDTALDALERHSEGREIDIGQLQVLAGRVSSARQRLPADGPYAMECQGLRAACWKRQARVEFRLAEVADDEQTAQQHLNASYDLLQDAYEAYRGAAADFIISSDESVQRKATLHWVLVQAVSLAAILGEELGREYWMAGRLAAQVYLDHNDPQERIWAHGSLAELWLLLLAGGDTEARAQAAQEARRHVAQLCALCPRDAFPITSTRRQLARYLNWWGSPSFSGFLADIGVERPDWEGEDGLLETARDLITQLDKRRRRRPAAALPSKPAQAKPSKAKPAAGGKTGSGEAVQAKGAKSPDAKSAQRPKPASGKRLGKSKKGRKGQAVFDVDLLAADYGDCIWIEYGSADDPQRVLIDCGPTSTFPRLKARVEALPEKQRRFELFVLSHIDADHIGGTIPFFKDESLGVEFGDVWFNGWKHLPANRLGAKQGEIFSTLVRDRKLPWNEAADGGPIMVGKDELPVFDLPGGMRLTLLSPTRDKLAKLRTRWQKELSKHGLTPGSKVEYRKFLGGTRTTSTNVDTLADSKFKADNTPPNGSSIAFLAEFEGKRALFAADAHVPVLVSSIETLLSQTGEEKLKCDLFKLSHHASQGNTSSQLIQLVDCQRFLVSTSGARFHHPDRETVARVIKYGGSRPDLIFNYRSKDNEVWAREDLQERYGYEAFFPQEELSGAQVIL